MLSAEQRLDAFEERVAFRSRKLPKTVNRFSDAWLLPIAQEFLNGTSWTEADTPEDLVARLRRRRAAKGKAKREKNAAARRKMLAAQTAKDVQGTLL